MSKIDDFTKTYRKLAKTVAKTNTPPNYAKLDAAALTAHAEVNKHLVWAFRHAVNGEVAHFEACVQDAKNAFAKQKEQAIAAMRVR